MLDREMRVLLWNAQSEEMWGVRAPEVIDRNFFALDIGFPVDRLASRIRSSLLGARGEVMPVIEARNRRGRAIVCRVECAPLRAVEGVVRGVILTMEEIGAAPLNSRVAPLDSPLPG